MRIHVSRSIIPNLFTVLNIFFGFLCITLAFKGEFVLAAWYVVFSALCDALDGFMARLTNSASDFGVELDSLADVVSFGVAPTVFIYFLFLHDFGGIGLLIASLQLLFGALRLARFNVQLVGYTKEYFTGMPIPLAALIVTSFTVFAGPEYITGTPWVRYVYIGLIVMNAVLMISTVRYPVFPKFSKREFKTRPVQMAFYIVAGIVIIATMGNGLFPVLFLIGISGPIAAIVRRMTYFKKQGTLRKPEQSRNSSGDSGKPATLDSH